MHLPVYCRFLSKHLETSAHLILENNAGPMNATDCHHGHPKDIVMICHDSLQCLEPSAQEKLDFYAVAIGFAVLAGIYGGQQTLSSLSNLHIRRGCDTCISSISFNYLYINTVSLSCFSDR